MTRNPILNALVAVAYITLIGLFVAVVLPHIPEPRNPIAPIIGFLSLFVLSAAVTGYAVIGAPLQLFLEGQKKEAVALFLKTLVAFAGVAMVFFFAASMLPAEWFPMPDAE